MQNRISWQSIRFDWNQVRAFLVAAEEGSLSRAATALDMTQPTLGRQVTAIEQELGIALFERSGRGLVLTPNGLDLLEHARSMGEAANRLSLMASGRSDELEGVVCITATEVMAAYVLPPIVAKIRADYPGIEIEIIASNVSSDLKRREADIAIRAYRPTQPDLIGRRIKDQPARLYATSAYLDKIGNPTHLAELTKAQFLGFNRTREFVDALNQRGIPVTLGQFSIVTNNHLVHWELVKQGVAIGVMPEDVGDAEAAVVRVLPDQFDPLPIELWLVAHREVRTSRRLRVVFDLLAEALSKPVSKV
ncbi:MAG: LysR family transcriptional regulator [Pseudomonadota bacterium]